MIVERKIANRVNSILVTETNTNKGYKKIVFVDDENRWWRKFNPELFSPVDVGVAENQVRCLDFCAWVIFVRTSKENGRHVIAKPFDCENELPDKLKSVRLTLDIDWSRIQIERLACHILAGFHSNHVALEQFIDRIVTDPFESRSINQFVFQNKDLFLELGYTYKESPRKAGAYGEITSGEWSENEVESLLSNAALRLATAVVNYRSDMDSFPESKKAIYLEEQLSNHIASYHELFQKTLTKHTNRGGEA